MEDPANKPKVFISALDWGLGHASRMVPVIQHCLNRGHTVLLGGSGDSLNLLVREFPRLECVWLPSARIRYSPGNSQLLMILFRVPWLIFITLREHYLLKKMIPDRNIGIVISDNRYGLYSKKAFSVIITHQLSPLLPAPLKIFEYPLHLMIKKMVSRFNECWVPDVAGENNLTGNLTQRFRLPANAKFTGLLSGPFIARASNGRSGSASNEAYDIAVILSGPEPQKSIFLNIILNQLKAFPGLKVFIAGGFCGEADTKLPGVTFAGYAGAGVIRNVIENSGAVICRPGYTSVMDLVASGRSAILVPTPGQTEQEYLAERLSKAGYFMSVRQDEFDLANALGTFREKYRGISFPGYSGMINNIPDF